MQGSPACTGLPRPGNSREVTTVRGGPDNQDAGSAARHGLTCQCRCAKFALVVALAGQTGASPLPQLVQQFFRVAMEASKCDLSSCPDDNVGASPDLNCGRRTHPLHVQPGCSLPQQPFFILHGHLFLESAEVLPPAIMAPCPLAMLSACHPCGRAHIL